jgi:Domain of unknown function (DUF4390)
MIIAARRLTLCSLAALLTLPASALAADDLRIRPAVTDNQVVVSFQLEDAYTDGIRDAIASGLRTTFTYELELRTKGSMWLDRTISTATITLSDQYDNLMRRHTLTRAVDGRVEDVIVTEDNAVVRTWLTKATRVPLCDTSKLDPTRDYYVRVTTRTRPVTGSLIGLPRTFSAQTRFTFIP